jgi:glycosyltransferase involved in cell wall biosynthesis
VALYAGTLHEDRLDVSLTVKTAAAVHAAGGTVVLVGPIALSIANRETLERTPGVRLAGPREHGEVPGYLQHADVLIVPHLVDEFTDSLDPIKLYEYLAVGRPIVSTPVAGFRDADSDAILLAADGRFPTAVAAAVAVRADSISASVPTWDDRCDLLWEVLQPIVAPISEPGLR